MNAETHNAMMEALPEHVITAVAAAITPAEIGEPGNLTSELVHRAMGVTYAAVAQELDRLRAIEDRANRVIAHIPDPDWIKAARFILDGHAGKAQL